MRYYFLACLAFLVFNCKPRATGDATEVFLVTADSLVVRAEPSLTAKGIGVVKKDTPVLLVERTSITTEYGGVVAPWYRVRLATDNRIDGYVFSYYLAPAQVTRDMPDSHVEYPCATAGDQDACMRQGEEGIIAANPDRFSRSSLVLTIRPGSGKPVVYTDNQGQPTEDRVSIHRLYKYDPATDCALVEIRYYEGGATHLIHMATGKVIPLWLPPVLSPDKTAYVVVSQLQAYGPAGIQVVDLTGLAPALALSRGDEGWLASDLHWNAPEEGQFKRTYMVGPVGFVSVSSFLRKKMGKWVVE